GKRFLVLISTISLITGPDIRALFGLPSTGLRFEMLSGPKPWMSSTWLWNMLALHPMWVWFYSPATALHLKMEVGPFVLEATSVFEERTATNMGSRMTPLRGPSWADCIFLKFNV